ncbi:MAG: S-layer homology domain-containing protein [Erysipelotrichaceae bacterium]|nr:S-layer homology domain-containing protein [Erysipelotrichaceae bacterium]
MANAYFIGNIGRSGYYIEWYASKNNWSAYNNTADESLFAQKFYWYVKPQQVVGDTFGLASQLADGDEVILYNAANGSGVGNTLSGHYVTAVPLTPEEGVITTASTAVVWTVVVNNDGTYSFTQGDKVLGGIIDGNYKNLVVTDATYTKWTLDGPDPTDFNYFCYLGEMTYNNGHVYLEYYNGFSLYGETSPSKDKYGITFYKKGAEPENPNPAAVGDLVTSLDQLDDAYVAIYSPGHGTAISTRANGDWYLKAWNATIQDNKVINYTKDMVWHVVNENGKYRFEAVYPSDEAHTAMAVWPSEIFTNAETGKQSQYMELTTNPNYDENTRSDWTVLPCNANNHTWYITIPDLKDAINNNQVYVEAFLRNGSEVYSGYCPYSNQLNANEFGLQFYLLDKDAALDKFDDGSWDGILNPGDEYVIYNNNAQKSLGLFKEANYAFDAIDTTLVGSLAKPGNGAYAFKIHSMGQYYAFEVNGRYMASNDDEELYFVDLDETDNSIPENAKWYLNTLDGWYRIYNKIANYKGTPVCIEYFSSVFSGWTFNTKNDATIYQFKFYKVTDDTIVVDNVVQDPSVVFDCEDSRCIEQDYQVAFSLDDLAADITSITISYITGTETKTVTDYTVSADKKAYSFMLPASEIDVESAADSFKIVVEVRNSYDIEYTGEKIVQILDEPFIEDLIPAPNAQTLDDKKPVISARVGNVGDNPNFVMTLNGEEVNAIYEDGRLTYQAAEDMEDGLVMVYVKCTRADGVFAEKNWNFTVGKADFQLYFGQLHSHTTYSDGSGTLDTALDYIASLPKSANVQFVAFTDHSNYFDTTSAANPAAAMNDASLMTEASRALWNEYRNKITTFNSRQTDIVAIAGYEMTWSGGPGHINSYNTDGLVSRNNAELNNKAGDAGMKLYYQTMNNDNGETLHQFNHPGATFGNFTDFSYWDEETDAHIFLVEVGNGEGQIGAGGYYPSYEQYIIALDKGWHLGPTNNQDNHKGRWGNANDARDVVLTNDFSVDGIYDAIRNLRIYATEDKNLEIGYTVNEQQMGTIFNDNNPVGDKMNVVVRVFDPDNKDSIVKVELVSDGGVTSYTWNNAEEIASGMLTAEIDPEYSYYFVRVTQADGDLAVTAPIWTRSAYKIGFESLKTSDESDKVYVNEPFNLEAKLYNQEEINAKVKSVTFTYNGNVVLGTVTEEQNLAAGGTVTIPLEDVVLTEAKKTTIRATAIVEVDGKTYTYTKDLDLKVVDRENEDKITPIAEVRQASDPEDTGYYFNIEGVVSSNASGYDRDTAFFDCIYVQDATGGICCFPVSGEYKVGDKVRISGYTDFYQGEPELQVETIEIIDELATPYELEPTEITAAQLNDRSAEGKLVTIKGTVDSFEVVNELVQTIMVKDAAGDLARVFIDGYITTENEVRNLEIGAECEVTGLASYDDTFPGAFPRIRIRDRADVVIKPAEDELDLHVVEMNTTGIDLAWNDTGSTSYQLYRDGELIATTSEPSYHDAVGRTMGYAYTYSVKDGSDKEYNELVVIYNPFIDVEEGSTDFTYIAWAFNHAIVNGIEGFNNIFSPQGNCERMNFCIMLWKIYGKPNPGKKTPFKDLKGLSTNNVKAITWLYNKKIVAGYSKTQFKPHNNITRAQLAIMLWKMAGKPSVTGLECPYTDIEVTSTFTANNRKAVIWCYNKGLIDSITGDRFEPDLNGTRALLTEMLYGYDEWFSDPDGQRQEIAVNSATPGIKMIGGRRIETEEAIYLDYCCSGIEFNADCRRKLVFNLTVSENCMFKIYIDEQLYQYGDSDYFPVEQGGGKLIVFVEEGLHNIRLVKVSHYRMALAELDSIVINGDILLPAPTEKEPFIEYIGDSLVCGWGVVGLHNGEYLSCDGTLAYPYLVSKALNADYAIFDMSGQGACYGNPSIQDCYLKSSYRRGDEEYDFPRQADAVVINIGTNDYTYNTGEENFHAALANIIAMVRQKHGDNVKILIVYNMKNDGYSSVLVSFAQQQGISILKCARSTNTATFRHPSIAEHAKYAEQISERLKELLGL